MDLPKSDCAPVPTHPQIPQPATTREKEFIIDNLLVRIHEIVEMILVDRPCAMGARMGVCLPGG